MSATTGAAADGQNAAAGIGLMSLGILLFSLNDVVGKWLAATYSPPQILLFRGIAALLILAPLVWRAGGFRALFAIERPWLQVFRAVLATVEVAFFYWAVAYLPLADAMTFYLAGPIYVTLLAVLFLGERVGWRRWLAIFVGFAGVVIALGPSVTTFGWPVLIALAGSILYSVFLVMTRVLRGTPDTIMATWQIAFSFSVGVVLTPFTWTPFGEWTDGLLLLMLGAVSLMAIVCVNRSLRLAPASVVVPFQYAMIVWAIVFGYIVFGDVPTPTMLIGAAIIVGAGLYIFFREQKVAGHVSEDVAPVP